MGRRLFGGRKREDLAATADWPQLPRLEGAIQALEGAAGPIRLPPPPPPMRDNAKAPAGPVAPAEDLLERITAFRATVADSLYETSKDYQMLRNLMHADVAACDEIIAELRRRLAGNIHYEVLAKLDDAQALVAAQVGGK